MATASGGMIALVAGAVILALICGFTFGRLLVREVGAARLRRLALPDEADGVRGSFGIHLLLPAAEWLMGQVRALRTFGEQARDVLAIRSVRVDAETVVAALMAAGCVVGLLCGIACRSLLAALAGLLAVAVAAEISVSACRARDEKAAREQAPEVLHAVERCLQAGFSLQQTFAQVGREIPGTLGEQFGRADAMMETGASATEALACLQETCSVPELRFLLIALDVQHQTGGSMREVLDSSERAVTARLDLARQLETQTTQARLSAEVVTAMPFVLLAVLSVLSPGFLDPLVEGPAGYAVLLLAILLQAGGVLAVRMILKEAGR